MDTSNNDILKDKLTKNTLENNVIHQKAIAILNGLKSQYDEEHFNGNKGAIKYLFMIFNLINKECELLNPSLNYKNSIETNNLEAMLLFLSVNVSLFDKDIHNCKNKLLSTITNLRPFYYNSDELEKYVLIILEKLLITSNKEDIQKNNYDVSLFFKEVVLNAVYTGKEKSFLYIKKIFPKLFRTIIKPQIESNTNTNFNTNSNDNKFSEIAKYSLIKSLKEEICKIFADNVSYLNNKLFLEFILILSQLFPFEYVSDFLNEINNYLKNNSDIFPEILDHLFSIIELTTKTKKLDPKLIELLLATLIDDNIQYQVLNDNISRDFKLKNSYYKTICELIINISNSDLLKSYEFFLI